MTDSLILATKRLLPSNRHGMIKNHLKIKLVLQRALDHMYCHIYVLPYVLPSFFQEDDISS